MTKLILGIETSCDETSVAIVGADKKIYAHMTFSQIEGHKLYGGVVPELAARAHLDKLAPLVNEIMESSGIPYAELSGVAATCGPGLIGGVVVGAMFGKGLAASLGIPFYPINHLEGHALTVRLTSDIAFPFLLLLVSGGHCQFLEVLGLGQYRLLGETMDDALGEAFDKVASMLNLDYPGGPKIEALAKEGNPQAIAFPRPLMGTEGCHFSFSGLKTAVRQYVVKHPDVQKAGIAASFQRAVTDVILDRTKHALAMITFPIQGFVLAGGVAANQEIRGSLEVLLGGYDIPLFAPPISLCTDNAAMIAWVGIEKIQAGFSSDLGFEPRPRWPLFELKDM